jgi:hypothetical protein
MHHEWPSTVHVSVSKAHTAIQRVFAQLQASDFALKLQARPRNRGCDSVHLAEAQTTRSGPEDLVIPSYSMREKIQSSTYNMRLRQRAASTRRARDRIMSLLLGHHRIMEAAEAALVMMVL